MASDTATPTREVLDLRLRSVTGETLDEFVTSRRNQRPRRSWRLIARDIYEVTGRDVTHETIRAWYPDDVRGAYPRTDLDRT